MRTPLLVPLSSFLKSDQMRSMGDLVNDEIVTDRLLLLVLESSFELLEEMRFFGDGLRSPFSTFELDDLLGATVFVSASEGLSILDGENDL